MSKYFFLLRYRNREVHDKTGTPNERIPDRVLGSLKPAGATTRDRGPEVLRLINTALEEDVQSHWAEF